MKYRRKLGKPIVKILNIFIDKVGLRIIPSKHLELSTLHKYNTYNEYRAAQITGNLLKIDSIWADEESIREVYLNVLENSEINNVLAHGVRNGYEVKCFKKFGINVIGTDISETATKFEDCLVHDFHDIKSEWINFFDLVYSNSLDHAFDPQLALTVWLEQLNPTGALVIELSSGHSPLHSNWMDPFGVKPEYFPYLLVDWFGDTISIKLIKIYKPFKKVDGFFYIIRKNVNHLIS